MRTNLQAVARTSSKSVAASRQSAIAKNEPSRELAIIATSRKGTWFPKLARLISQTKPAAYIAHVTGEKERTAYDWCGGAVDPPARAIIKLLQSPVGWVALEWIMRGNREPWWRQVQEDRLHGDARRQVDKQLQLI